MEHNYTTTFSSTNKKVLNNIMHELARQIRLLWNRWPGKLSREDILAFDRLENNAAQNVRNFYYRKSINAHKKFIKMIQSRHHELYDVIKVAVEELFPDNPTLNAKIGQFIYDSSEFAEIENPAISEFLVRPAIPINNSTRSRHLSRRRSHRRSRSLSESNSGSNSGSSSGSNSGSRSR